MNNDTKRLTKVFALLFLVQFLIFSGVPQWVGNKVTGFLNPAITNLDMNGNHIRMGAGAIGNDDEILTFAAGASGAATFAGSLYIGGEADTGFTVPAADQLGMWAGGVQVAQANEDTTFQFLITPGVVKNDATKPSLGFGDGNTGFYESADNNLRVSVNGVNRWLFIGNTLQNAGGDGACILNETASSTNPTVSPGAADQDTGVGAAAADQLSLIAGAVEGIRISEATTIDIDNKGTLSRHTTATITASTTQTQGNGALTADINEVSVCANANDTVTLPTARAGMTVIVINNGAQTLRIFPASGDDLGAGVDTASTIATTKAVRYVSYDATNWVAFSDN